MGGLLGAAIARAGTTLLVGVLPETLPRTGEIAVDATVLTFAIALSVLTGLLFGLAPALSASRGGGAVCRARCATRGRAWAAARAGTGCVRGSR